MKKLQDSEFIIADLIVKKLENKLTVEEAEYLSNWKYEKESHLLLYHRLLKSPEKNYFEREKQLEKSNKKESWKVIKASVAQKRRQFFLLQTSKFAAVLTVLLGIVYYFNEIKKNAYYENNTELTIRANDAMLITASGEKYQLDQGLELEENEIQIVNKSQELNYKKIRNTNRKQLAYNTIIVPKGGKYKLTLVDGTVVNLNSNSSLRYPSDFGAKNRKVFLKGEALFDVTKDTLRPFIVGINQTAIKVLGTSFNVSAYETDDEIVTTLVEGKVNISNEFYDVKESLHPNEQVTFSKTGGDMQKQVVDTRLYTAWVHNRFVFENETLEHIMKRISREYDLEVFFLNNQVRNLHFTGDVERYEDVSEILEMLEITKKVRFTKKNNSLLVE